MSEYLFVAALLLTFAAGAFISRLLDRFAKTCRPPNRAEQAKKILEEIAEWIEKGKRKKLLDNEGKLKPELEASDAKDLDHQVLDALADWSKSAPTMRVVHGDSLAKGERDCLVKRFWNVAVGLLVAGVLSASWITWELSVTRDLWILSLVSGFFGSTVAAFRSCLDRRSQGFEDRWGNQVPDAGIAKERFGDGMIPWFIFRPFLGAAVALVLFCGLKGSIFPEAVKAELFADSYRLAFYMMLTGLFAKTLLDIFLELTKKILKV